MTDDQAEAVLVALADSPAPWARPGVRYVNKSAQHVDPQQMIFEIISVDRAAGTFRRRRIVPSPEYDYRGDGALDRLAVYYRPLREDET